MIEEKAQSYLINDPEIMAQVHAPQDNPYEIYEPQNNDASESQDDDELRRAIEESKKAMAYQEEDHELKKAMELSKIQNKAVDDQFEQAIEVSKVETNREVIEFNLALHQSMRDVEEVNPKPMFKDEEAGQPDQESSFIMAKLKSTSANKFGSTSKIYDEKTILEQ